MSPARHRCVRQSESQQGVRAVRGELRAEKPGVAAGADVAGGVLRRRGCGGGRAAIGHGAAHAEGAAQWVAPLTVNGSALCGLAVTDFEGGAVSARRRRWACGPVPPFWRRELWAA